MLGRDALHVLENNKVAGVVTYRDLSTNLRENGGNLKDSLIKEYPTATLSTQLFDLYPLAQSGLPIALLGRRGSLDGVVLPEALFAKLAGNEGDNTGESAA